MSTEADDTILDVLMADLLQAIYEASNSILSEEAASAVVGREHVVPIKAKMDKLKLLMPADGRRKGEFELTAKGLVAAMRTYATELVALGMPITEETLMEIASRRKQGLGPMKPWSVDDPFTMPAPRETGLAAFVLPLRSTALFAELTRQIPHDWSWVSGRLHAPPHLVESGEASRHGGITIDQWNIEFTSDQDQRPRGPYARILSREEHEPMMALIRLDLQDLVVKHLLPGYVEFREAAFDASRGVFPFASVLATAIAYLERGYTGELNFYSRSYDDRACGPEEASVHFDPWVENDFGRRTNRPPVILVQWVPAYGGKQEKVASLIEFCRSRSLEEVPTALKDGGY